MCCGNGLRKLLGRRGKDVATKGKLDDRSSEAFRGNQESVSGRYSHSLRSQRAAKTKSHSNEERRFLSTAITSKGAGGTAGAKPNVADVYKRIKVVKEEGKDAKALDERVKNVKEAQIAMGIAPNATLIERYVERAKKVEQTQDTAELSQIGTQSRMGDIPFSFPTSKKDKPKNDDTLCPEALRQKQKASPIAQPKEEAKVDPNQIPDNEELREEDEEENEQPNSENYMFNDREISFTCRDMMTQADVANMEAATGNLNGSADPEPWNAYAPVEELQRRHFFDCQTLRRHTFISNSGSMPDAAEKTEGEIRRSANPSPSPVVIVFDSAFRDISVVPPPALQNPIPTNSLSCAQTIDSTAMTANSNKSLRSKRDAEKPKRKSRPSLSKFLPLFKGKDHSREVRSKDATKEMRTRDGSKEPRTGRGTPQKGEPQKVESKESRSRKGSRENCRSKKLL